MTGFALVAATHAWSGKRWLLPRVFALPRFRDSFYFDATPRIRFFVRAAWQLGTAAWLCLGILLAGAPWIDTRNLRVLIRAPMVLMVASPLILGAYLGALLKARIGTPSIGVTILLLVALILVIGTAWYAA